MLDSRPLATARPIDRLLAPITQFMAIQAASGLLLLACAVTAIAIANSPWADEYAAFWHTHLRVGVAGWAIDESLLHWINDGLMTVFFFVVGLEIKRELADGELSDVRKAALPLAAALGGMIVPAVLYAALMRGELDGRQGWGIPMATDIAFVVGFLALLGSRVPTALKVFLLALAIIDDIGAILVIAIFYSSGTSASALAWAAAGLGLMLACRWLGVRNVGVYVVIGVAIWLAMFHSGVHPTVAGVIIGLMTPSRAVLPQLDFVEGLSAAVVRFQEGDSDEAEEHHGHGHKRLASIRQLRSAATETISPLEWLEAGLHPWVAFVIMPVFALANAGVSLDLNAVTDPIARSVAIGLVVGKPLGIVLLCGLAVKLGLARLPQGISWPVIAGAGCLAGIGFTMSIFIAGLALEGPQLAAGKLGTILGSLVSTIAGLGLLAVLLPAHRDDESPESAPMGASREESRRQ